VDREAPESGPESFERLDALVERLVGAKERSGNLDAEAGKEREPPPSFGPDVL